MLVLFLVSCLVKVCLQQVTDGVAEPTASGQDAETEGTDAVEDDMDDHAQSVRDVVDTFLSIVEQYERNKDNCTPGVEFNLGEGVVAQYGVLRYKAQAMVAVNRANFLTRIWKGTDNSLLTSEYFFYSAVRSMVEGDPDLFAAGNCYDHLEFQNYTLFCPYAFRTHNDSQAVMVKDLSVEYYYMTNASEFFYLPRIKAQKKLDGVYNETKGKSPCDGLCVDPKSIWTNAWKYNLLNAGQFRKRDITTHQLEAMQNSQTLKSS